MFPVSEHGEYGVAVAPEVELGLVAVEQMDADTTMTSPVQFVVGQEQGGLTVTASLLGIASVVSQLVARGEGERRG